MKVKLKKDVEFIHENASTILESSLFSHNSFSERASVLDLLRYRNYYAKEYIKDEYKVYKTIYYNTYKYYLLETNITITIDENHYSTLCLINADDVEEVEDIEVGDKVKVTNDGLIYSTYGDFFTENNLEPYLMINYQYSNNDVDIDDKYTVEYIGTHRHNGRKLCVIKEIAWSKTSGKVYLIEIDGLMKVD